MTLQPSGNIRTCPEITEHHVTCNKTLVGIKQGDEMVYGCQIHGWQATIFEDGSNT